MVFNHAPGVLGALLQSGFGKWPEKRRGTNNHVADIIGLFVPGSPRQRLLLMPRTPHLLKGGWDLGEFLKVVNGGRPQAAFS